MLYFEECNCINLDVQIDKGYSGKNLDRPDFERLCQDIKQGLIKRVIVYKLDRISRSILDFSNLMIFFEKHGVEFISTTEKFDTSTPVGRAMLNICIVFAQLERETIQQRVADAYHSRSKQSFYMGGKIPYGFKQETETIEINGIKTSKYVIDHEESSQIKLIYSLYADENYSLNDIVKYLLENKIYKTNGAKWQNCWISDMLRNPVYVQSDLSVYQFFKSQGADIVNPASDFIGNGCYLYKGTVSTTRTQSDLKDKVLVLAPHEGFIPPELWLKCRMRCLKNKRLTTTCKAKNSWLTGKTKCGNCGYALIIKKSKAKWGRYCVCSSKYNRNTCEGTGGTIYADLLEEYISEAIKNKLAEFDELSDYRKKDTNPKVEKNQLKLVEIDNEIDSLLKKVTNANEILMDYINNKIDELDKEKKTIQQENFVSAQMAKQENLDIVRNHVQNWDKTSFSDKQSVVNILIDVIHVKNGEIAVQWNI